jgi:L-fuculose-phosphate aldolase
MSRPEIIATAHKLASRGWVANHDGNISMRLRGDRFLATPTATAKADVCDKNLIEVDETGKRVAGTARPFSELKMHLAIFADRSDVGAVVHAHPPYATALACTGSPIIEKPFIAEAVVSLGPWIPTMPFAAPGPDSVAMIRREVARVDAVLLANHGVFSWGPTLELAFLRMELVEHLARIATLAQATGGIQPLPEALVEKLLASRSKAKLGAAADRALDFVHKPVVACAPAPHANVQVIAHSEGRDRSQLASIIKEELNKLNI